MSRAEIQGFAGLLEGQGFDVFVGEVDSADPDMALGAVRRYALILPTFSPDQQARLTGSYAPRLASFVVHCYGKTWDEAGWLHDRVDTILRPGGWGLTPTVTGRRCDPLTRTVSFGPDREEAGARLWDAFHEYQFMSYPS